MLRRTNGSQPAAREEIVRALLLIASVSLFLPLVAAAQAPQRSDRAPVAGVRRILELIESEHLDEASALLEQRLATGRQAPAVEYLLARVRLRQQRFADAETLLRSAIAGRGDRPAWHHALAAALLEQGRCAAAIEVLDQAITLADQAMLHYDKAMCALNIGRFELAEAELHRTLALEPGHSRALFQLGLVASQQSDEARALELFRRTITLEPSHVEARFQLGLHEKNAGNLDAAIAAFRVVRQAVPGHVGAALHLGRALVTRGDRDEGRRVLEEFQQLSRRQELIENQLQYIHLDPTALEPKLDVARLLLAAGRTQEALEQLLAARRLDPDHAGVLELLAEVNALRGLAKESATSKDHTTRSGAGSGQNP